MRHLVWTGAFAALLALPVAALLGGVKRIAGGDLELNVRVNRRDEFGELADAFNDMVSQLRTRRELQRQVEVSHAATRAKSYGQPDGSESESAFGGSPIFSQSNGRRNFPCPGF